MSKRPKNKYSIEISQTMRSSLNFMDSIEDQKAQFIKQNKIPIQNTRNVTTYTLLYKVFPGPQQNIKVIAHMKLIIYLLKQPATTKQLYIFDVHVTNLETSTLRVRRILQKKWDNGRNIRDIVVSPSGNELYVLRRDCIQKYRLVKQKYSIPYGLVYQGTYQLERDVLFSNAVFHPSQNMILAIEIQMGSQQKMKQKDAQYPKLMPVKIELDKYQINRAIIRVEKGQQIQNKCLSYTYFKSFSKWNIAINKNNPEMAIIGGRIQSYSTSPNQEQYLPNKKYICQWNIPTMRVQFIELSSYSPPPPVIQKYEQDEQNRQVHITHQIIVTSVGYLNQNREGYLVGFQSVDKYAHVFSTIPEYKQKQLRQQQEQKPQLKLEYTNVVYLGNSKMSGYYPIKCIDIPDIDSVACISDSNTYIYISKIDYQPNTTDSQVYELGYVGYSVQRNGALQVFYYAKRSQVCAIYQNMLQCWKISTSCANPSTNVSAPQYAQINECNRICRRDNKFWNPQTMECQQCPISNNINSAVNKYVNVGANCECTLSYTSFNPYKKACTLDCSKIKYAAPQSMYGNGQKCVCMVPYTWFDDQKVCRINCSSIRHSKIRSSSVQQVDQNSNQIAQSYLNECECNQKYEYKPSNNTAGTCLLICKNNKAPLIRQDGEQYCECQLQQEWDYNAILCRKVEKSNSIMPVWAIVLIAISILVALGVIAFFVRKKMIAEMQQSKDSQSNIAENGNARKKRSRNRNKNRSKRNQAQIQQDPASTQRSIRSSNRNGDESPNRKYLGPKKQIKCRVCSKQSIRTSQPGCIGPCNHYYHLSCISQRFENNQYQCPVRQCKMLISGMSDLREVERTESVLSDR